jgi:hypothetical protein
MFRCIDFWVGLGVLSLMVFVVQVSLGGTRSGRFIFALGLSCAPASMRWNPFQL